MFVWKPGHSGILLLFGTTESLINKSTLIFPVVRHPGGAGPPGKSARSARESSSMAASQSAQPLQVPPLPPKLRREPQRSSIGKGLLFADEAAFEADHAAWLQERTHRQSQIRERERVQDQLRDRSQRQRGTAAETDSQRRVRQKREHSQREKQLAQQSYAQLSACLFASAQPQSPAAQQSGAAKAARRPWRMGSDMVRRSACFGHGPSDRCKSRSMVLATATAWLCSG